MIQRGAFPHRFLFGRQGVMLMVLLSLLFSGCSRFRTGSATGLPHTASGGGASVYIVDPDEGTEPGPAGNRIPVQTLQLIDDLVSMDVSYGFPGAQLAVLKDGELVYQNAWGSVNAYTPDGEAMSSPVPVTNDTLFDLASVTKMFSVVYAMQKLVSDGKLDPETPVTEILGTSFADSTPEDAPSPVDTETMREWKSRIRVRDLLCHEAGMPPDPRSFRRYMETAMAPHTREELLQSLFLIPLRYEPGTQTLYSDLDYMLAGLIVEEVTGQSLDTYLKETFFEPMGLSHITYNPLENGFTKNDAAATELNGNTRDGHVSHEGIRTYTLQGEVHDENAYHALEGVSGHAGLFSNATDLAYLASLMFTGEYDGRKYFSREVLDLFTGAKNEETPEWGIGWWRAEGQRRTGFFTPFASDSAIGHNGWTGTSVIIDPEKQLVIVYLTNRINSPVTNPDKSLEDFDGGWFSSGILSTVPSLLYGGLERERDEEALMQVLSDLAKNSFRALPEDETPGGNHPAAKNTDSKLALFRKYAQQCSDTRYTAKADLLQTSWEGYLPENADAFAWDIDVLNGDMRFDDYLPLLANKRVALYTNHTGVIPEEGAVQTHILDALLARNVNVTAAFAPEHGIRGDLDAGATVEDTVDEATGVPVYSLYGSGRLDMPDGQYGSDSLFSTFDILVVDIQDIGVRFYTYYLTMFELLDVCAQLEIPVLVLDRPNPNGFYVDGPVLEEAFHSGVGRLPIPVVHGMTIGELAQMMNGEGWFSAGKDALDLTVIPCAYYTHKMKPVIPVAPSPNLKDMRAVYLYPSVALFENSVVSVGRGTAEPFVQFGSPYFYGTEAYAHAFVPASVPGATSPPFLDETCYGKTLRDLSYGALTAGRLDLSYVADAYRTYLSLHPAENFFGTPDDSGAYWIDYLLGTGNVRKTLEAGDDITEIRESWTDDVAAFKKRRAPYLLYPE